MSNPILKCAIVDDSTLQRLSIVRLIKNHPSLELIAEYSNAIEAKIGLATSEIDLVFLDIEMPILSGFALLDDLTLKPQIIFVTGKTKYAFKAFDYDAVDYLRKPIFLPKIVPNDSKQFRLVHFMNHQFWKISIKHTHTWIYSIWGSCHYHRK